MIQYDLTVTLPFILTAGTLIYTWWRTRDRNVDQRFVAVDDRFKLGSDRMDRHEARLNSVEQTLRTLPAKDDLHELQLSIEGLKGELKTMAAVMEGNNKIMGRLENIVARHEDHLLETGKR